MRRRLVSDLTLEPETSVILSDRVYRLAVGCHHIFYEAVIMLIATLSFAVGDSAKDKKAFMTCLSRAQSEKEKALAVAPRRYRSNGRHPMDLREIGQVSQCAKEVRA